LLWRLRSWSFINQIWNKKNKMGLYLKKQIKLITRTNTLIIQATQVGHATLTILIDKSYKKTLTWSTTTCSSWAFRTSMNKQPPADQIVTMIYLSHRIEINTALTIFKVLVQDKTLIILSKKKLSALMSAKMKTYLKESKFLRTQNNTK